MFVGGKFKPGSFPEAPESFVLKNVSTKGHIHFEKDKSQTDTTLSRPGMVSDAAWFDVNKDGWEDLVVVGAFMPITIFENHNGKLIDATKAYGLSETNGWWCRILADDVDNDGDTDLVIGNMGNNTQLKASAKEPVTITYGDFYGNGNIDPVLCYYNDSKSYPFYSKDEMADQIPSMQKKFLHYADYADAQLSDLFTKDQLSKASTVEIKTTQSVYLRNDGKKFSIEPLPLYAQMSVVNGIISDDVDSYGNKDLIIAGNFYPFRVQMGACDASMGLVLKRNDKEQFSPLTYSETGLCLRGDVRSIITVKGKNNYFIVAAKNNDALQVLKRN